KHEASECEAGHVLRAHPTAGSRASTHGEAMTWCLGQEPGDGSRFAKLHGATSVRRDRLSKMSDAGNRLRRVCAAPGALRRILCLLAGTALAAPAVRAGGFDFAALLTLVRSQDIGSVEELLAALPAPQRTRYALMFESRSLQGASPENPRVILFGPDARLILTFNGSPAQRGFRVVETMEFEHGEKEFRLRELVFPDPAAGAAQAQVSEVNPPHCARCHGAPPRPVWDSFPLWPAAYGERYGARLSTRDRTARAASGADARLRLRFVGESARGVDTRRWTLAREKGTYDFTLPPPAAQPLREGLLAEVAARDASVQDLSRYSTSSDGDRYCSYLKRRSRAALGASKEELSALGSEVAEAPSAAPGGPTAAPGAPAGTSPG